MPIDQNPAAKKADAARAAMDRLKARNPALATKIVTDFAAAGYKWSATVAADLRLAAAINARDARTIEAFLRDPAAVKYEAGRAISPFAGALDGIGVGAGVVAGTPEAILPAVGDMVPVTGFLRALTDPNLWLRVTEVGLGLLLIVVGLVKLTGPAVTNVVPVGRIAKALR